MTVSAEPQQSVGWTPDASTFGARLAMIRQHKGWGNVKEAAQACGVPAESWRNWERDGMEPRRLVVIAKQFASASGCDYHWLVLGPEGATRRYGSLLEPRVVAPAGRVITPRPIGAGRPRGAVSRTRPIAAGSTRPVTPVPV